MITFLYFAGCAYFILGFILSMRGFFNNRRKLDKFLFILGLVGYFILMVVDFSTQYTR